MMIREVSQSDDLTGKTKQEVGGASKPLMEFIFLDFFVFFVRCFCPFCPCV